MKWLKLKDDRGPVLVPVSRILYVRTLPEKQGTRIFFDRTGTSPIDVLTEVKDIEAALVEPQKSHGGKKP